MCTFLASLERFPNWQHDVELFLPVFGNLETVWKRQAEAEMFWMCFGIQEEHECEFVCLTFAVRKKDELASS